MRRGRKTTLAEPNDTPGAAMRLDKWLVCARFRKTRSRAAALIAGGAVRVNREKVRDGDRRVHIGDTLTLALERTVLVVEIRDIAARRGPATQAQALYTVRGETAIGALAKPKTQLGRSYEAAPEPARRESRRRRYNDHRTGR